MNSVTIKFRIVHIYNFCYVMILPLENFSFLYETERQQIQIRFWLLIKILIQIYQN